MYENELNVALESVRVAARVCRNVQAKITSEVLEKKDRSPVTIADYSAQAIICRTLKDAFPDDPVIGEEGAAALREPDNASFLDKIHDELGAVGIDSSIEQICEWIDHGGENNYSDRFWTLDPIDGTKGFLRGEQYAISLALIISGNIEVGILCCPNLPLSESDERLGATFCAVRGQGAVMRCLDDDAVEETIAVTQTADTSEARFCESVESGHSAHGQSARGAEMLGITKPPVRLDSQAKYAVVARGEADIYLRLPTRKDYNEKIWDHAGGVIVVEEAGGRVTDIHGKPLDFTHGRELKQNKGVVVSNGLIHGRVIQVLDELSAS